MGIWYRHLSFPEYYFYSTVDIKNFIGASLVTKKAVDECFRSWGGKLLLMVFRCRRSLIRSRISQQWRYHKFEWAVLYIRSSNSLDPNECFATFGASKIIDQRFWIKWNQLVDVLQGSSERCELFGLRELRTIIWRIQFYKVETLLAPIIQSIFSSAMAYLLQKRVFSALTDQAFYYFWASKSTDQPILFSSKTSWSSEVVKCSVGTFAEPLKPCSRMKVKRQAIFFPSVFSIFANQHANTFIKYTNYESPGISKCNLGRGFFSLPPFFSKKPQLKQMYLVFVQQAGIWSLSLPFYIEDTEFVRQFWLKSAGNIELFFVRNRDGFCPTLIAV